MKTHRLVAPALLIGVGLGLVMSEGSTAQSGPPAYYIAEIAVTDLEGYEKNYAPEARGSLEEHGGRLLAAGQNVVAIEGEPPAKRIAIVAFDNMAELKAWRNSDEFKKDRQTGEKYANFRSFAVEGVATE